MTERERFEAWITRPPFERDIARWPEDGTSAWPGKYKNYAVELAWCAWQDATVKITRVATQFSEIINTHCIAMQAAVIDGHVRTPAHGLQWIVNTLSGPGLLPDMDEAKAMGGAQAWFDATMAEEEARRAALGEKT